MFSRRLPLYASLLLAMLVSFAVCRAIKLARRHAPPCHTPRVSEARALASGSLTAIPASATGTVRVAAIQSYSRMGRIGDNRERLAALVEQAAARGARIVVLPECAVQGYSCVIGRNGKVLAMARTLTGSEIVLADLPVPATTEAVAAAEPDAE